MTTPPPSDVTHLLNALNEGDEAAADSLIRVIYDELKAVASAHMRSESPGHTLQPTALVHEAYLRLVNQREVNWQGRSHFVGVAAQAMRRVLIDHARRRNSARRGGGNQVTFLDLQGKTVSDPVDLIALDSALNKLAAENPRHARIVELRYFGGLTIREAAEVLKVSDMTVKRGWQYAKAWLQREIDSSQ